MAKRFRGHTAFCGVDLVNFQPGSTKQDEKIRTGKKNRRQAQFWHSRPGYFPGGADHIRGEKTDDRQPLKPSAVSGPSPSLFLRWYLIIQAEYRTQVAKSLSEGAISDASPGFSARRKRLLGEEIGRSGRRRNRAKRHFRGASVTFPPSGRRRAGGTKPAPAHQIREVGTTAVSPWLFSRRS